MTWKVNKAGEWWVAARGSTRGCHKGKVLALCIDGMQMIATNLRNGSHATETTVHVLVHRLTVRQDVQQLSGKPASWLLQSENGDSSARSAQKHVHADESAGLRNLYTPIPTLPYDP
jgi:hypothetical protein